MKSSELQFGDTFMAGGHVVVYLRAFPLFPCLEDAGALILRKGEGAPLAVRLEDEVKVLNRPTLTPVQRHADELRGLVRAVAAIPSGHRNLVDEARALLDKIDPPKPPTLDEALAMLQNFEGVRPALPRVPGSPTYQDEVRALLDRARRSGVLK